MRSHPRAPLLAYCSISLMLAASARVEPASAQIDTNGTSEAISDAAFEWANGIAVRVGEVERMASYCHAPQSTYISMTRQARMLLPTLYIRAGYGPSAPWMAEEIQWGGDSAVPGGKITPTHGMPCALFRRTVSDLVAMMDIAQGIQPPPLAPKDEPGWQSRP